MSTKLYYMGAVLFFCLLSGCDSPEEKSGSVAADNVELAKQISVMEAEEAYDKVFRTDEELVTDKDDIPVKEEQVLEGE